MQKYKILKVLGDGAFGTVFKAVNTKNNEVVAIKKMKQKYKNWQQCLQLRQIKSLRKISHQNIIKLKQVLLVSEELHLVFQYLSTNIYEEYSNRKKDGRDFSQKEIKSILFQLAQSLAHLHKNGFFHRDLKPENILIDNSHVSLCDFGLARQIRSRPPFTDYVSTRWYRAPQLLLRSTNYNSPVDVFAFGCIAAELYNLSPIFPGNNDNDQLNRIVKVLGTPDQSQWPEGYKLAKALGYFFPTQVGMNLSDLIPRASSSAINLIQSCLKYSSRHRLSMLEVIKHEYFQGLSQQIQDIKQKEIKFDARPEGELIGGTKQQKKLIEEFRMTKQKFRKTRIQEAFYSDPLRNVDKAKLKEKQNSQDLDQILKELEEKKVKQKNNLKQVKLAHLPTKATKERFYTQFDKHYSLEQKPKMFQREKTYIPEVHNERYLKKQEQKGNNDQIHSKNNIFGFKFQPASLPYLANPSQQKHSSPYLQHRKIGNFPIKSNSYKQSQKSLKRVELTPMIMPFHY